MRQNTLHRWCVLIVWVIAGSVNADAISVPRPVDGDARSWSAQWLEWIRAGEHARTEADIERRLQQSLSDVQINRRLEGALDALARRWRVEPNLFETWLQRSDHGAVRLVRAKWKAEMAWTARGTKWAREVHADNFARMHALMADAEPLYQEALDLLGPQCDHCHGGLVTMAFHNHGSREAALAVDRALQSLGGGAHQATLSYLHYLQPKWGGSWKQAEEFVQAFARDHPGSRTSAVLRGQLAEYKADELWKNNKSHQAAVLLHESLTWHPENASAWASLAALSRAQGDQAQSMDAANRALRIEPEMKRALVTRAALLLGGPEPAQALPDLERATVLGSDWALINLVPILANGLHGTPKAPERAAPICRAAMERDTPISYACMGTVYYFGFGEAVNKPKALGYFLEASDRGLSESAVDAGFMLIRGDGVPRDEEKGIAQWIRAADAGEEKAVRLLKGHLTPWMYFWRVQRPEYIRQALAYAEQVQAVPGVLLAGLLGWLFS